MKITCPKCGHVTEIAADELSALDNKVVCPSCMSTLKVDGDYAYIPTADNTFDPDPEPVATEQLEQGDTWVAQGGLEDPLLKDAIEYVEMCNAISTEMLQRYLGVDFARAADIMRRLEEKGIIGPATGGPRQILIPHSGGLLGNVPKNREELAEMKDIKARIESGEVKTHVFGCSSCMLVIIGLLVAYLVISFFIK